ncbi:PREDICTED: F-box/kelch-repeat protein At1g24800-like [Camelina sativa]|uniref:F-box/kelch-repeat protein At1g24800-like n=1 Tax=Camelina sativa TaxID=90675 RepID=A0ABM0YCT2_CAMSA|nr:PREDICTED: F-box/kelch-repeat protein At1g24800-like [Camelina sativa]
MTRAGKKKAGRMTRRRRDLLPKLVGWKISTRIPIAFARAVRSTCKLERRRTLISIGRRQSKVGRSMTRAGKTKVGRSMKGTRICDLPLDLVGGKILTRVPITSLGAVRNTCKLWNALTKDWVLGEASAPRQQFLGFMTMNSMVCSAKFHSTKEKEDLAIKQVDLLNQVKISKVHHCDGLLLCVAEDKSRLVVWNPYLGQTRPIRLNDFHWQDNYAFGYDMNRNHKIVRFQDYYEHPKKVSRYEIYQLSSNSWRDLKVHTDLKIKFNHSASVKGNAYFFAQENCQDIEPNEDGEITDLEDFLICFDFTTETFGPPLPLPFHSGIDETVTFSSVRDEQLVVLYHNEGVYYGDKISTVEFWVTTKIEPNSVSWSKFLQVNMRPVSLTGELFEHDMGGGTFFIDEEQKVAVVFDIDGYLPTLPTLPERVRYHTAFISGEDGYFKPVTLGVAPNRGEPYQSLSGPSFASLYCPPVVCSSSYLPSLVQLN